jgi:alpha-ketoglutarate-dependent taurine dioxygenase
MSRGDDKAGILRLNNEPAARANLYDRAKGLILVHHLYLCLRAQHYDSAKAAKNPRWFGVAFAC